MEDKVFFKKCGRTYSCEFYNDAKEIQRGVIRGLLKRHTHDDQVKIFIETLHERGFNWTQIVDVVEDFYGVQRSWVLGVLKSKFKFSELQLHQLVVPSLTGNIGGRFESV